MNGWQYLLLVNLYITIFYVFYLIFLRKETFFQLNRLYLIAGVIVPFFIPLIQAGWVSQLPLTRQVQYSIYANTVNIYSDAGAEKHLAAADLMTYLYLGGAILLTVRLLMRLLALRRVISLAGMSAPFSFFRKIHTGDLPISNTINEHEKVHAGQWHSVDVMLMELVTIINWFNPVIYFYSKSLKSVHEFIADEGALKSAPNKADYALLLFSQTFETPVNNLVNPFFNKTLLKQRIMMIQKNKSRKMALLKYSLAAPLFILMLILTSATANKIPATSSNAPTVENAELNSFTEYSQHKDSKVFTAVEHEPTFPGGTEKFKAFLSHNIKYPKQMRDKKVQGKVFLTFIVEKDGSLSGIKVLRDIGYGAGNEALRVLSMSPKWEPGIQNGKKVRVAYTVPISFML